MKTPIHSLDVFGDSACDCASVDEMVQKAALVLCDQNSDLDQNYILNLERHYQNE